MFATARYASILSFAGALVVNTASPAIASGRSESKVAPVFTVALDATLATMPTVTAAVPPTPLADAAQSLPVDLGMPRRADAGFGAPTLRRSLYISFGVLQVLDGVSTRKALNAGATEANPAMGAVVKSNTALIAVKAGSAVATTFFAERLARKHPRRAAILMAVLNTAYAGIVVHNYRVARGR